MSGKTISGFAVVSTNAAGTTFTVDSIGAANQVQGGVGIDKIVASSFNFTQSQRDVIFASGSIEQLQDSSGTYTTPYPPIAAFLTSDTGISSIDHVTSSAAISGTGDANATVTIRIDNVAAGTVAADGAGHWSYVPTGLVDGAHSIAASESNASDYTRISTVNFTLDTAITQPGLPDLTADSGDNTFDNSTKVSTPSFAGLTEASATVQVSIDGAAIAAVTANSSGVWSYTSPLLVDGPHTISVIATDPAGNVSTASNPLPFVIDTAIAQPILPNLTTDSGISATDNITNVNTPSFAGATEANASVQVLVDNVVVATVTADIFGAWTYTASTLADGIHTISIVGTDPAGNISAPSDVLSFGIDTIAAQTVITDAPANPAISANAAFTFMGSDPGGSGVAGFEVSVDGSGFVAGSNAQSYSGLADGVHTMQVRAIDAAGNVDATPASYTWRIDTIAPTVNSVTTSPESGVQDLGNSIEFAITMSEAVAVTGTPQLLLSNGVVATFTGGSGTDSLTFSYTVALGQTSTDLQVSGFDLNGGSILDAAGNAAIMTAVIGDPPGTLQIDAASPVVSNLIPDQSSPEDAQWIYQVPTSTFTDSDGDALTYQATLGDGSPLPGWLTFAAGTQTLTGIPPQDFNGTVDLRVTASDGIKSSSDTFTLTVTAVNDAPEVTGAVTGSATEAGVTVTLDALANASDVDDGDVLQVTNVPGALPDGVSYDAATHSFTLDPTNAAYQHLAAGEQATVTVNYGVTDSIATTGASVSWTVTGTNDAPVLGYSQTFVVDTDGITAGVLGTDDYGQVQKVASGVNGITAPDGDGFYGLVVETSGADGAGPFTQFGGYSSEFVDGQQAGVKVYLDTNWAASEGFQYSVAANGQDGVHQRDFVFEVRSDGNGHIQIGAANGTTFDPITTDIPDAIEVTTIGWYTLQHVFHDVGGQLSVDLNLIGADGVPHLVATLTSPDDTIADQVGGNRYGWFTDISVPNGLAVDDYTLGAFTGRVVEVADGPTEASATYTANGGISFTDVDASDVHTVSVTSPTTGYLGVFTPVVSHDSTNVADGHGAVNWTFTATNAELDHLAAGQTVTQTYTVAVSDGTSTSSQDVTVSIVGTNDAPEVTGAVTGSATEAGLSVTLDALANASDVDDGDVLQVTSVPGTLPDGVSYDAATHSFTLDPTNAAYQHLAAGEQVAVTVNYGVTDSIATTGASVSWTVTGINDAPVITSGAAASEAENTLASHVVYQATATDADIPGGTTTYSLSGTDAARFDIDGTTGAVTFKVAPNFEAPTDADHNNVYDVVVTASDGTDASHKAVAISATDVNDVAPVIVTAATLSVAENQTNVAVLSSTDVDTVGTNPAVFSVTGGADAALFTVVTVGGVQQLHFIAARDYETQAHSYQVEVTASDGVNTSSKQITVNLTDTNDTAPVITSGATATEAENTAASHVVYQAAATDADSTGVALLFALAGADAGLFNINAATGAVTFKVTPDFEAPGDAGHNNTYDIDVTASDGVHVTHQAVAISVTGVNEAPTTAAAVEPASGNENSVINGTLLGGHDPEHDPLTFKLVANSAEHGTVTIDAATGAYSFTPDHDYHGPATFAYVVSDGQFDSAAKAVSLTVANPVAPAGIIDLGVHPGASVIEAVGDFNGDGTSDVLFRDPVTGRVDEWRLTDGHWQASTDLGATHGSTDWSIKAAADFNGDGTSDVLWFNAKTGAVDEWQMQNGNWAKTIDFGTTHGSTDWQIAGTGDFNGDGTSDILWFNAKTGAVDEWQMQNGNWAKSFDLGATHGSTDWQVAGIGDFNGDGTSDILWSNRKTGQIDEWQMQNGNWAKTVDFGAAHGSTDWQVAGIGDANADGTSDVLWLNSKTGAMDLWKMADGNWNGSFIAGTLPGNQQVAGIGLVNQDHTADVLLHNTQTGDITVGLNMNVADPHFYGLLA